MSREVRMVPPDWEHPKDNSGEYIPLLGDDRKECLKDWDEENGEPPGPEDFMPEFAEGTATHFRMYESVSEGTPISPPFETAEKLASWLVDTGASSFGSLKGTYDEWMETIKQGWVITAVETDGDWVSGVQHSTMGKHQKV